MQHAPPTRIAVVGNAGSGKSTLAEEVGRRLGIEVVHLDKLLWRPGWQISSEEEFGRRHAALLDQPSWVIEGLGYSSTIPARFAAADAIIFTRYPLWRCCWWSLKRELRPGAARGRPEGCSTWRVLGKLLSTIWRSQVEIIPRIDRMLERHRGAKAVRVLRAPSQIPRLLEEVGSWGAHGPATSNGR